VPVRVPIVFYWEISKYSPQTGSARGYSTQGDVE
jgi:hypothetical protein